MNFTRDERRIYSSLSRREFLGVTAAGTLAARHIAGVREP